MSIGALFILAVGLSMDACAVSICKGLATKRVKPSHMILAGLWFGGFQALMPLIGYLLGTTFEQYITKYDHWIAFVLLGFLGVKMILEAFEKEECECCGGSSDASFAPREMLVMAIATSIDALAVGISLAILPDVNIWWAITFIGVITFVLSALGVKLGNIFGAKYKSKAEFAGGVILVLMGTKILLEHLGVL